MIGPSMDYLEHQYDIAHGGGDDVDDDYEICDKCGSEDHSTEDHDYVMDDYEDEEDDEEGDE